MHGPYPYHGPRRGADLKVGARRPSLPTTTAEADQAAVRAALDGEVLERYPLDLIRVSLRGGVWYAQFIGPHAEIIRGLFGTDLIPTPWTGDSDPDEVLADLMARNPGFEVSIDC
jgi:hypothetical protein